MQRALPFVIALVITVLAIGSAAGLNLGIRSMVAPTEEELAAVESDTPTAPAGGRDLAADRRSPTRARVKSEREYIDIIMRRNLFDPEAIAAWNPEGLGGGGGGGQAITDLKVRLVGTVVAEPAKYSAAFIVNENDKDSAAVGYSIGHKLQDAEIIGIEKLKVTLKRGNGNVEVLTATDEPVARASSGPASSGADGGGEEGIEQVGDNQFVVDRSLIEKHIGDIEGISKMGRALLHRGPDGEFDGYRLSAIRRNTLADQLGIKNGDIIHSVNGQPLNSVQNAMNAYQTMMNGDKFAFEVTRRGQTMTLEYDVR